MDERMREKTVPKEKDDSMILSRDGNKRSVLFHAGSRKIIEVDEHTASKLMLLESLGETDKSQRIASRLMGGRTEEFRLDAALLAEIVEKGQKNMNCSTSESLVGAKEDMRKTGKEDCRKSVLDAHVTGIGAAGDFQLTARIQDHKSGEVHEVKGVITGFDAAMLRSDTNEQGRDGTVLRNAQALACENFEKGMSAAFTPHNAMTMKME